MQFQLLVEAAQAFDQYRLNGDDLALHRTMERSAAHGHQ